MDYIIDFQPPCKKKDMDSVTEKWADLRETSMLTLAKLQAPLQFGVNYFQI